MLRTAIVVLAAALCGCAGPARPQAEPLQTRIHVPAPAFDFIQEVVGEEDHAALLDGLS